ncbi:MAG: dihydrodipicolinate synthase family protein, partial [Saprospiraceae bacterium]|nr:dihydrodipicolinate synthase family protein [Saprospiraceae bacterium]
GAVGSTYNYAAPLYHEVVDHFTKGDHASAMLLQRKAVQVVQFLKRFGGLATGKAIMNILGVEVGAPRLPFRPLSMEDISALERGLREIGFFEFCSRKH